MIGNDNCCLTLGLSLMPRTGMVTVSDLWWNSKCWMILANLITHFEEMSCENVSVKISVQGPCLSIPEARHMLLRLIYSSWVLSISILAAHRNLDSSVSHLLLQLQVLELGLELCSREEWNQGRSKVPIETAHKSWWYLWSGWQVMENIYENTPPTSLQLYYRIQIKNQAYGRNALAFP